MIDPRNITNYNLNDENLRRHLLFWITVAGKKASTIAQILNELFGNPGRQPWSTNCFLAIQKAGSKSLSLILKWMGIGCYRSKAKGWVQAAWSGLDLRTCTAEDLEKIHGVGMKTSRCFIMHSRRDARYAGLDTHILKYLREQGIDAPKSTPTSRRQYLRLEKEFLKLADAAGYTPANFDLIIWRKYAKAPDPWKLRRKDPKERRKRKGISDSDSVFTSPYGIWDA